MASGASANYFAEHGALPLAKTQTLRPETSWLPASLIIRAKSAPLPSRKPRFVRAIPLRLIGLGSHSGFSSSAAGLWPFGISNGPIDRIRAAMIGERHITLEYVRMDAPEATEQIVSGIYADHWMGKSAVVALKNPRDPRKLRLVFYLPNASPQRIVRLLLDGREVARQTYSDPGPHTLESPRCRGRVRQPRRNRCRSYLFRSR